MDDTLHQLNQRALIHQVIDQIREHIVNEGLVKGDRIPTEREIAVELGVGRSTVREAMTVLETLGAVARKTKRGTVVSEVDFGAVASIVRFLVVRTDKDLSDLFEARRLVEVSLLPLVHQNWSQEVHEALKQEIEASLLAIENGNHGVAEELRFHEQLVVASGNVFLRHYTAMIQEFFSVPSVGTPLTKEQQELTVSEHSKIVEALANGDVPLAQSILFSHLSRYLERGIIPTVEDDTKKILR